MIDLLALVLAVARPYQDGPPGPWLCQLSYDHPAGSIWIARSLKDNGRIVFETVYFNRPAITMPRFSTYWKFRDAEARRPVAAELIGEIPLSRRPVGAVRVAIVGDGKIVRSRLRVSTEVRTYSGRTILDFAYAGGNRPPDIHGLKSLTFVAVEDGGEKLGSLSVALPDWKLVDRQVDQARRDLARAFRQRKTPCTRRDDRIYD
jgi:hypothetical protein